MPLSPGSRLGHYDVTALPVKLIDREIRTFEMYTRAPLRYLSLINEGNHRLGAAKARAEKARRRQKDDKR